jgi:hypothetical protein
MLGEAETSGVPQDLCPKFTERGRNESSATGSYRRTPLNIGVVARPASISDGGAVVDRDL